MYIIIIQTMRRMHWCVSEYTEMRAKEIYGHNRVKLSLKSLTLRRSSRTQKWKTTSSLHNEKNCQV